MASRKQRRAALKRAKTRKPTKRAGPAATPALIDQMTDTLQMGKACWERGKRDEALALYERGVKELPHNIRAYLLAARVHAERYRLAEMEVMLDRLRLLAPDHPGVHHYIAETYTLTNQTGCAVAAYEKACALPGVQPGTWMELAAQYERSHRLDEARGLVERARSQGLRLPLLALIEARLLLRDKRPDAAEAALRDLIGKLPADEEWACKAWADLALLYDRQGEYEQAIEAIGTCKQAQRGRCAKEQTAANSVLARFGAMVQSISAPDFNRWRDEAADLPDTRSAILAGFPRSGTTLLEQVLDAHDELVSSEERDYLGKVQFDEIQRPGQRAGPILDVLNGLSIKRIRTEQQNYFNVMEQLLGEPIAGRMHLDKNPAYNLFLPVLLRLFPQSRILIALRDPRDVVLSCYLRYLPLNPVSVNFLSVERTAQRYALDMNAWLKFRDIVPNPWCEVRYEDSVADLEKQARRALETLGLPWDPAVMDYRERLGKERQVSSPTYEAVKQPVYTRAVGRWKHYEEHLAPAFETLAPFIEAFGYDG
ncbi:sulfotransferase [Phycisphaeraceae bacterium D3-23]